MTTQPYRDTTAVSELTGEPVSTWSEEWRHECEARAVLAMAPADRETFFNGHKEDKSQRGIVAVRGEAAADALWQTVRRLHEVRAAKKQSTVGPEL
ncbi:DUF7696 family protein [Microvirga tunisiensis]|uniref:Uncharacterized protein n=1 Tax=Microvirga tunisiensis TaxID=2108360 RepID=A0A5N7MBW4_9HYPH|nr:hypothetical protein [Microvirga tunisiensis]MPR08157.1 hypothetical protein [Microvirga tunisiensis]MPR24130.1 hypothetical protein [Microvirga tunisiensis]